MKPEIDLRPSQDLSTFRLGDSGIHPTDWNNYGQQSRINDLHREGRSIHKVNVTVESKFSVRYTTGITSISVEGPGYHKGDNLLYRTLVTLRLTN